MEKTLKQIKEEFKSEKKDIFRQLITNHRENHNWFLYEKLIDRLNDNAKNDTNTI